MSLSVTNIANALFKKLQGKSSTSDAKQYFEESRDGRQAVFQSQIVAQSDLIPTTAPGGADQVVTGVVKRWIDLVLTPVPGLPNAFFNDALKSAIPFNFGDGSYNYALKDSAGNAIPFGSGDWIVDGDSGTVTFYGAVPANMPPRISFYQYVGTFGATSAQAPFLTLARQTGTPTFPPVGFDRIYVDSTGKPLKVDSTGAIKTLGGGGGGAAGKNYLADLYDGTSVTGIVPFDTPLQFIFNGTSNLVDVAADTISVPDHNYGTGQQLLYTATFGAIGGLVTNTIYFAVRINANTFGLATTLQNAAGRILIDLTSQGTNTQSFSVAAPAFPSGSSAAAPTGVTTSLFTAVPLRAPSNQRLSKTNTDRQGRGWRFDLTLDRADTDGSKQMKLAFKYRMPAGYASGDVAVHLLDLTTGFIVPLDGALSQPLVNSTTTAGFQAYCTPSQNSSAFRLVFTIVTSNNTAYDIDLIDLEFGLAGGQVPGVFGTDVQSYTPTGPWTSATAVYSALWYRDKHEIVVRARVNVTGTLTPAVTGGFTLPPGLTIDLSKLQFGSLTPNLVIGKGQMVNAVGFYDVAPYINSTSTNTILFGGLQTFSTHTGQVYPTDVDVVPAVISSGHVSVEARVPIVGWSASATYSTAEIALKQTPNAVTSAVKSQTANGFQLMANNFLDLPPGQHDLDLQAYGITNGTSPSYLEFGCGLYAANGTDTGTAPAEITTLPGVTVFGPTFLDNNGLNSQTLAAMSIKATVKLTQPTRIYGVPFSRATTPGNARINVYLVANKRPDYSAFGVYGQLDIRGVVVPLFTPSANAQWVGAPSNSGLIPVGTWKLTGHSEFLNGGTSPVYARIANGIFGQNGNASGIPSSLGSLAGVTLLTPFQSNGASYHAAAEPAVGGFISTPTYIIRVTQPVTVFMCNYVAVTTLANVRIQNSFTIERLS